jgi:trehalose 6-phosphate phosphatase
VNASQPSPGTGGGARLEGFLAALPHACGRLLMLDYDGTLAPFRAERDDATPYPGVVDLLHALTQTGDRIVLITGRPAADVADLLAVYPPPEIWGVHGLERLFPDGRLERTEVAPPATRALEQAARWAENRGFAAFTEVKPGALALHWRGADSAMAATMRLAASAALPIIARDGHLELREFDGGLELRAPGPHKGDVVRRLLHEALASEECAAPAVSATTLPVDDPPAPALTSLAAAFLGDDFTDEDAFRALKAARNEPPFADTVLLGVLVRDQDRPTDADERLCPPEELLAFLARWVDAAALPTDIAGRFPPAGSPEGVVPAGACHQGPQ